MDNMREVMMKAQELGEAILASDVYKRSKAAEEALENDVEATRLVAEYMEKQRAVNEILSSGDVDTDRLAQAGLALQEAEDRMKSHPVVKETQEANAACNTMLDNVNRIIQLIVRGRTEDASCTGNCASCGGCGSL